MDPSGRGRRSGLVRWAGLVNGSRIAVYVSAGIRSLYVELLCLNRAGFMLNLTSQWQNPDLFFVIGAHYEKVRHILKLLLPKFRSDLSIRLRNITEKRVPAKLKPIVGKHMSSIKPVPPPPDPLPLENNKTG